MEDSISITPEVFDLIHAGSPVAIGISGGKDSGALALSLSEYLDSLGHPKKKRVLVHADLGLIEWPESLEWCEKLAAHLDIPLVVVRRQAGGMIERWEKRWVDNFERYQSARCLRTILPWSTASMRFCTSELKTDVICSALKKRFAGETIISAVGIRAEESASRAKAPVSKDQAKLRGTRAGTRGVDWNPIITWKLDSVWAIHKRHNFPLHPAYTQFGASRVSCSFCILSTAKDQLAALSHPSNRASYIRLCELELKSAFSFQGTRWLCDLDPALREELIPGSDSRLKQAKALCTLRQEQEARLPSDLNFKSGTQWPPRPITTDESFLLSDVRGTILAGYGLTDRFTPESLREHLNSLVAKNVPLDEMPEPVTALLYQDAFC